MQTTHAVVLVMLGFQFQGLYDAGVDVGCAEVDSAFPQGLIGVGNVVIGLLMCGWNKETTIDRTKGLFDIYTGNDTISCDDKMMFVRENERVRSVFKLGGSGIFLLWMMFLCRQSVDSLSMEHLLE